MLYNLKMARIRSIIDILGVRLQNAEQVFTCADFALKDTEIKLSSAAALVDKTLEGWHVCLSGALFDPVLTEIRAKTFLIARKRHEDALELFKSAERHRELKRLNVLEANYNVRHFQERMYDDNRQIKRKKEEARLSYAEDLRGHRIGQKC